MWNTRSLTHVLSSQQFLRFYQIMHYPVPNNAETYFQYFTADNKVKWHTSENDQLNCNFSRSKKCKYMDEYLDEIKRLELIFKSIPFVEQIFLCNSITFNALDDNSDIDLFIITKPWRIRSTKLWSMILFSLKWVKRYKSFVRKKICLSFFVTSDSKNLYPISLSSIDIYLCYWIAHLVQIYKTEDITQEIENAIFSQNKWISWVLPNFPWRQTISLWIDPFSWNTKFKNFIEHIGSGIVWDIWELIFKSIQKLIIKLKIQFNPEKNKDVIISNSMLKFHQDVREKISLLYNIKTK